MTEVRVKLVKPKDFEMSIRSEVILSPLIGSRSGSDLQRACSGAIEFARLNPSADVHLEINSARIRVESDDTIRGVEDRWREQDQRNLQAFLATAEGQEYTRRSQERERAMEAKRAGARKLLDALDALSSFRFPADMPRISRRSISPEDERALRKQISVGAQWLADHPEAKPFEKGHEREFKTLEGLMEKTDSIGHSIDSLGSLMNMLATISHQGFDRYVAEVKRQRAASGRSRE